jgi:hypothetical protein
MRNEINRIFVKRAGSGRNYPNYMIAMDLWVGMDITNSALVKAKKDVVFLKVGPWVIQNLSSRSRATNGVRS